MTASDIPKTSALDDERVVAALNFRPPGGTSHDDRCDGCCGPCGGTGGVEAYTCLTCHGSGECRGCGFGEGYAAGAHAVYNALAIALSTTQPTEEEA